MMYDRDFDATINNNKILQKYRGLLKKLSDAGIMCVGYDQDGTYYMIECCDQWYLYNLTKDDCNELSKLFKEISEIISE